jgi:hypothetical protein
MSQDISQYRGLDPIQLSLELSALIQDYQRKALQFDALLNAPPNGPPGWTPDPLEQVAFRPRRVATLGNWAIWMYGHDPSYVGVQVHLLQVGAFEALARLAERPLGSILWLNASLNSGFGVWCQFWPSKFITPPLPPFLFVKSCPLLCVSDRLLLLFSIFLFLFRAREVA